MLDPRAAATATHHLNNAALERMEAAVTDAGHTLETSDTPAFYRASEVFRNGWLASVPNGHLRSAINRYQGQVQAVRMVTMTDRVSHEVIVSGLKELLDAFVTRDAIRVHDAMLNFVVAGEANYIRLKDKAPD